MQKIRLRTAGVPLGENLRARQPDLDHANTIHEFGPRYKIITAVNADGGLWTLSIIFHEGAPFSNSPEGTTRTIRFRPHKGMDDGRLYDDQPEWIDEVTRLVRATAPEGVDAG